jgi:hypothetical protein
MLIILQTEVYHDGNVRVQLRREDIPLSKRFRAAFMVNTDREYMLGLNYIASKNLGFRTHYDSDMGFGYGIIFAISIISHSKNKSPPDLLVLEVFFCIFRIVSIKTNYLGHLT